MTPKRPYLLRAIYQWLLDNQLTPHLVVDATIPGVVVPRDFVNEGQIVLNINPSAVGGLALGDDEISFNARFSGQPMKVQVPMAAAMALYARENGAGAIFEPEAQYDEATELDLDSEAEAPTPAKPTLQSVDGDKADSEQPPTQGNNAQTKSRPSLKVIK
ncbi:ClpXP protease specificity-enhancing factor [Idiomarina xiamenensis]|uniref:ClpXP protease specificity-enhancing factor n=1 Tax=Idiomarina xiamenensis 10-D-4 TaxID=740709 RepID=K2KSH3_9GAMM|nr:ClpXP protease specificity-enhancing factor [Idiomarina xiamenensis]EKE85354.1 ClpXP protease specificity-enhancing factor [Idiomarina xiamenensis 10-D-4]